MAGDLKSSRCVKDRFVPAKVPSPSDLPTLEGCARRLESISQGWRRQEPDDAVP